MQIKDTLTYAVGAGSDPGKRRKRNDDSIFAASSTMGPDILKEDALEVKVSICDQASLKRNPSPFMRSCLKWLTPRSTWNRYISPLSFGLFVVADGTGAYANGQDASSGAIQAIVDCILPKIVSSKALQPEAYSTLLAEAVQLANKAVHQQNIDLHSKEGTDIDVGVYTTVTAAMVVGSTMYVANVGNCRTYLYRAGEWLKQITKDHSWVARQVEDGRLTPDAIYTHAHHKVIDRALFDKPLVEIDIFTVPLQPGDTLLLCSPGLWTMVRDPKIEDVISHVSPDPSKAAEMLIQTALDGGGRDNVSVIVVSILEAQDQVLVPGIQLFVKPESVHIMSPLPTRKRQKGFKRM